MFEEESYYGMMFRGIGCLTPFKAKKIEIIDCLSDCLFNSITIVESEILHIINSPTVLEKINF